MGFKFLYTNNQASRKLLSIDGDTKKEVSENMVHLP